MAKHDISPEMTNPARIVTLANTPNYIFHYLRRDPTVQALSLRSSTDLTEWLKANLLVEAETLDGLARRYAYLMALSLKDPAEYLPALELLDFSKLEWGDRLKQMIKLRSEGVSQKTIKSDPKSVTTIFSTIGSGISPSSRVGKIEIIGL
jgi:hypothetical protein